MHTSCKRVHCCYSALVPFKSFLSTSRHFSKLNSVSYEANLITLIDKWVKEHRQQVLTAPAMHVYMFWKYKLAIVHTSYTNYVIERKKIIDGALKLNGKPNNVELQYTQY